MRPVSRLTGFVLCVPLLLSACFSQEAAQPTTPVSNQCRDPRPQMCMEIYQPVCAVAKDGSRRTYANSCHACADATVIHYDPGQCAKE